MRRILWHEHHVAGAELEQLAVEAKVIVAFADDERLVVGRVPMVARAGFGRLDGFADGIDAPALACGWS
jgi:hypothetical protein